MVVYTRVNNNPKISAAKQLGTLLNKLQEIFALSFEFGSIRQHTAFIISFLEQIIFQFSAQNYTKLQIQTKQFKNHTEKNFYEKESADMNEVYYVSEIWNEVYYVSEIWNEILRFVQIVIFGCCGEEQQK